MKISLIFNCNISLFNIYIYMENARYSFSVLPSVMYLLKLSLNLKLSLLTFNLLMILKSDYSWKNIMRTLKK
jgi:hypothetical protein